MQTAKIKVGQAAVSAGCRGSSEGARHHWNWQRCGRMPTHARQVLGLSRFFEKRLSCDELYADGRCTEEACFIGADCYPTEDESWLILVLVLDFVLTKGTSPFFWFRVLASLKLKQTYKKKPQTDKMLRASVVSSDSIEARAGEVVIREVVVYWNFLCIYLLLNMTASEVLCFPSVNIVLVDQLLIFFINEAHSSVKFHLSSPEKLNHRLSYHLSSLHMVVLTCCHFVHFESRQVKWSICQIELEELFGKNV